MVSRRKFLQLMGGIAALPALGKFASAPKKIAAAKKGIAAAGQSEVQSILPDVIATVMKKGKDFDTGMPTSSFVGKEYKGVKVTESPDEIFVEFTTDSGNSAFASIKKADYVVDQATGKSVYKPPEYEEGQQVFRANGPDDYYKDIENEVLDSVNDLRKIAMEDKAMMAPASRPRVKKSGGGIAGSPPVYQTGDPKEAAKVIIDAMMGGSGIETLPIYSGDNLNINAGIGVGAFKPFDYGINFQYGDFGGGAEMRDGTRSMGIGYNPDSLTRFGVDYSQNAERGPMFGLQYERRFADGGGVKSGPPPERGPLPQGLETLFQTR